MGDEGKEQARKASNGLVEFAVKEIKNAAASHPRPKQAQRIANGVRISKSSVVGEFGLCRSKIQWRCYHTIKRRINSRAKRHFGGCRIWGKKTETIFA